MVSLETISVDTALRNCETTLNQKMAGSHRHAICATIVADCRLFLPFLSMKSDRNRADGYWRQSLYVVFLILGIWGFVSLGCGILFRDFLDAKMPTVGNAPFGFWMAQQGAIIGFLILLFLYMVLMNWLDRRNGFDKEDLK